MVVGQYSDVSMDSGCWLVGLTKVGEDDELPDWNFRFEKSDCEYSPALLMNFPGSAYELTWYSNGKKVGAE